MQLAYMYSQFKYIYICIAVGQKYDKPGDNTLFQFSQLSVQRTCVTTHLPEYRVGLGGSGYTSFVYSRYSITTGPPTRLFQCGEK